MKSQLEGQLESPLDVDVKSGNDSVLNQIETPGNETENVLIDENDHEGKLFEDKPDENKISEENEEEPQVADEPVINETEEQEAPKEENLTLEENNLSLNDSESILETTNVESEPGGALDQQQASVLNESLEEEMMREHDKKDHESVYSKKEMIRRKPRQPNRFADGNLIPEEDDNPNQVSSINLNATHKYESKNCFFLRKFNE